MNDNILSDVKLITQAVVQTILSENLPTSFFGSLSLRVVDECDWEAVRPSLGRIHPVFGPPVFGNPYAVTNHAKLAETPRAHARIGDFQTGCAAHVDR